jgi:hypothetical protein
LDTTDIWVDNCTFVEQGGLNRVVNGGFEQWAVGIEDPSDAIDLVRVFPNPAEDYITVTAEVPLNQWSICDLSGRALMEKNMTWTSMRIDISTLPDGLYILNLTDKNLARSHSKFLKK